jgi:hypothetical protein
MVLLAQLAEHPLNIDSFFFVGLTGAMVARLPTEQEVVGSSPTLGFKCAGEGSSILPRGPLSPVSIVALYLLWVAFFYGVLAQR